MKYAGTPDVEIFKEYFDATSLHKKIAEVRECDAGMLRSISCSEFSRRLTGTSFTATRRYGKYLFARFNEEGFLVLHFGMTGFLRAYKNEDQAPAHIRLLRFDDGFHLAFDCRRKLGSFGITDRLEDVVQDKKLGPDALELCGDREAFAERLQGHSGTIKGLLMNQKVLAGIGNVYADEILFQEGIHPQKKSSDLGEKELAKLAGAACHVLNMAIQKKAGAEGWPDSWLLPRREKDEPCPRCSGKIRRTTVSGRGTYFCPEHQKK